MNNEYIISTCSTADVTKESLEVAQDVDSVEKGILEDTILPDDEAFILESSGYEKLRYVTGWVVVVTRKEIASMSCDAWAKKKAKELLGKDFETKTEY